jgi:predicted nucleic acid-binding protein
MNSRVCVDASLIVRALVPGRFSDEAEALLAMWQRDETTLIAPTLLAFEVTSTLRRLVHLNELTPSRGDEAFAQFLRLPITLSSGRGIFPLAWSLAKDFCLPRAYDTAYLAVAKLFRCEFWTADERLYHAVGQDLAWVKWIGNYCSPAKSPPAD